MSLPRARKGGFQNILIISFVLSISGVSKPCLSISVCPSFISFSFYYHKPVMDEDGIIKGGGLRQ